MSPTIDPPVRARFDPERWAWLIAPIGAILLALSFTVSPLLSVAGVGLLALSCVTAERKFLLFGPFLRQELTRMSRKQRVHLWRPLVATAMGLPVLVLYYRTFSESDVTPVQAKLIASGGFAILFFYLVLICGSAGLTYLSYAIAEDRESKRMDFVLVTDLRGRELVIGKLFARAVGMAMYILPAIPIILSLPVLFGVEPEIILYTFGYFGVTMLSLAGLAALGSVKAATKKASGSWILKYVVPYVALSFGLQMLQNYPSIWFFPGAPQAVPTVAVGDVVDWITTGNLIARLMLWANMAGTGGVTAIARDFPAYAAFHTAVGLLAFMYASSLLRSFSSEERQSGGKSNNESRVVRPPVDDFPIRWKEQYFNPLLAKFGNRKDANRIAFFAILVLFVLPTLAFLAASVSNVGGYGKDIIAFARFYPMCIVLIAVSSTTGYGLHAIAKERERDTLTGLLLSPIEPKEIMEQKRSGILALMRQLFIALVFVGIGPIACGAWAWWAYPVLIVFAIQLTHIGVARGMLQSANAQTVEAAQRWNGLHTVFLLVGGSAFFGLVIYLTGGDDSPLKYLFVGVIPPLAIIGLGAAKEIPFHDLWLYAGGYLVGFVSNFLLARWIWRMAVRRFEAACDPAFDTSLDRSANEREIPNVLG